MDTTNKELTALFEKIEGLGWSIDQEDENIYRLSKYSPAGQDFSIQVQGDSPEEFIHNLLAVYEDFDVSEETYIWLDNFGHGKNGAPHHMRDVLEDMETCEQYILDLYNALI